MPALREFAKRNKGRVEGRQRALWPAKGKQGYQSLKFTSLVCPMCLVVSDVSEQEDGNVATKVICKCKGKGRQHSARADKGATIWDAFCLEQALACRSIQAKAQSYKDACIAKYKPQEFDVDFEIPKPLPLATPAGTSTKAPSKPPVGASPKAAVKAPTEAPSAATAKASVKQPEQQQKQQQPKAERQRKKKQKPKQQEQQPKQRQPESKRQQKRQSKVKAEANATANASTDMHRANAAAKAATREAGAAASTKFDRGVESLTRDAAVPADGKQPMLCEYEAVIKVTQQPESDSAARWRVRNCR